MPTSIGTLVIFKLENSSTRSVENNFLKVRDNRKHLTEKLDILLQTDILPLLLKGEVRPGIKSVLNKSRKMRGNSESLRNIRLEIGKL